MAVCCYSWHCNLRPLKGCFAVRSGSSNLTEVYSCFRPFSELGVFRDLFSNCEGRTPATRAGYSVVHDNSLILALPISGGSSAWEALFTYSQIRKKS